MSGTTALSTLDQLVARSRRLGADRTVCNWGGGNTSAKSDETDFRGSRARVLWVKGSGSDLATVTETSFTGLYLDDIAPLAGARAHERHGRWWSISRTASSIPSRPRPSIETLLHGFLPFTHIDHTHADATNYFACAPDGERLARECFGDELIWIPYRRPGFGLARDVALAVRAKPDASLVILAKHGLITWGETDEECYTATMATIDQARDYVETRIGRRGRTVFGGLRAETVLSAERRRESCGGGCAAAARAGLGRETPNPALRGWRRRAGLRGQRGRAPADADWRGLPRSSGAYQALAAAGGLDARAGCGGVGRRRCAQASRLRRASTSAYLEANAEQDLDPDAAEPVLRAADAASDPHPRVILIPGVGMFTTGKDTTMADVAAQLYHRAIAVMRGAEACGGFISLTDAESYAVEYWPLEQYKLKLAPPEREFARQVALVTGGAGGIGSAIGRRLARDGAHVILADIDLEGAEQRGRGDQRRQYGAGRAVAVRMDVTNEESVRAAFAEASAGLRRHRYLREQRRAGLQRADHRDESGGVEPQLERAGHRLFPGGARRLPRATGAGTRRPIRLRRQQERAGGRQERRRLLDGQGG